MPFRKMEKNSMTITKTKPSYHMNHINKYDLLSYTQQKINDTNNRSIIIIPNLCNTNYTYGGLISKQIAKAYPIVEESYNVIGKVFISQHPGYVQLIETMKNKSNKLFVANMIAQTGVARKPYHRTINYSYLTESMHQITQFIYQQRKKYNDEHIDISIHSYKFGIGKSCNANWDFITCLIEDIWLSCCNVLIFNR